MKPLELSTRQARAIWLRAQRLDQRAPFGAGPEATRLAIEHLGYVQIDTINVIERCHHHILFTRIPDYRRADLQQAQSIDKTAFEYWTHALAYVPVRDFRFFLPEMKRHRTHPSRWNQAVDPKDYRRVIKLIRDNGPITIRDIEDDELREKEHPWASRKPSKAALQLGFWNGVLTISARTGMLKTYELMDRHFGWETPPKPATERQMIAYLVERALRAQGVISVDSVQHTSGAFRKAVREHIEAAVRRRALRPVVIEGAERIEHWASAEVLENAERPDGDLVHILSPFDPLVIQRKRTERFFAYGHVFEAYVPKAKRRFGYFTLPVLVGDEIVAAIDLKTDRAAGKLLIQSWHWVEKGDESFRPRIEEELHRFEAFQLA